MRSGSKGASGKKKFFRYIGPGLTTGASDDDPSGIATYSQAGARFGGKLLWTAIATYPLMVVMQEMCARIGLVTDSGLTGVIKKYYSKSLLYFIVFLSFTSITLNIGADIAGMGAVGNLLFPRVPAFLFSILFTVLLMAALVLWNYKTIAMVLKWLCLSLFSYVFIPFLAKTDWREALHATFFPVIEMNKEYFLAVVGILGTTISPYLFFWQTSMEAEERNHRHILIDKLVLNNMKVDVRSGMLFSNLVFYFIILATGTVLFSNGIHTIDSVQDAALALKPLAGDYASLLFSVGVIGTGALAIPVLAGSLGYMMAETFGWEEGLDKKFNEARSYYLTMIIATILGLLMNLVGINPIQALMYTAVLYGIVAPFMIALILHICNSKVIMGQFVNSFWPNLIGLLTLVIMTAAAVILIVFML